MFKQKTKRNTAFTFHHFNFKGYAAFNSLKCELRIGVLSMSTLLAAHNECLATRSNALQIVGDSIDTTQIDLNETVVTGSRLSVSANKAWSKLVVISRQEIEKAECQTINDVLKLCPEVDVRQRGAFGVQTDISLGGGTFDQITILINGVNVNNPQTGHLAADFPLAVSDIERIEILNGASARMFGSQALNGIINIITRIDHDSNIGVHAETGSHGTAGGGTSINLSSKNIANRLSANYFRTDGAVSNSDFNRTRLFYQGRYTDDFLKINWQAGYSGQKYGANTFYSAKYPNQWEEGNRYMTNVSAATRQGRVKIEPSASFIRTYDHFQLIRNNQTGENFHRHDVSSVRFIGKTTWAPGQTAFGAELRHEGILSTTLGKPIDPDHYVSIKGHSGRYYNHRDNRTNQSAFLEHAVTLGSFSANIGLMTNRNTMLDEKFRFYPGIDLGCNVATGLRLYTSWNKSMRLPTFTDLYYKSPTIEGNIGLQPERMSTFKLGADYKHSWLSFSLEGIYRRGTNMIDWVMYTPDDIYHSAAFKLSNLQLNTGLSVNLRQLLQNQPILESLKVSYFYNHQKRRDNTKVYLSNYALDYLRHKLMVSLDHNIISCLGATWYCKWQERLGTYLAYHNNITCQESYRPVTLLDLKLRWFKPTYNIYASFENILARRYYDLGSVPQPRFTFLVGANYKFNIGRK